MLAIIGACLTGCAGNPPIEIPAPFPPTYPQLAAGYAASLPKLPIANAAISSIRPTQPVQPGDWFACLKLTDGSYYAVFFADGKIVDFRSAVGIDHCPQAGGYFPLPPPPIKKADKA